MEERIVPQLELRSLFFFIIQNLPNMGELKKNAWRILEGFGGIEKSFKSFLCCYNTLKDIIIKVSINSDKASISRTIIL
jgi:hypothetical protein